MSEIDRIEKDKKNDFHGYKYASEQAIKEALHPLLVKHGLVFTVETKNVRREVFITDKGKRGAITDIDLIYKFYDTETGEFISGDFVGTGDDSADKGTYKAITGAIKYILTSTFLIPTGDDPENETQKSKTAFNPETEKQPSCDVCGALGAKSKTGNWYCPNYKTHGKFKMVHKQELSEQEQSFADSLDQIK